MKTLRTLIVGAAAALLAAPAFAAATTYEIDPAHSSAGFNVKHMMVSTVRGVFGKVTGTVVFDAADLTRSSAEASIDVKSVDTRDAKRDGHLQSPDFFDAATYPTITFKSTKFEAAGAGKYKVTGNLTIRGVTKPVVLDVDGPSAEVKDPWGNTKIGATATTRINRQDFGVKWNAKLDSGGVVVSDDVNITLDLEAAKKVPAAAAPAAK